MRKLESMQKCNIRVGLSVGLLLGAAFANAAQAGVVLSEQGSLQRGDRRLTNNEYYDTFTFDGTAGQRILIELGSVEFDTYVMLTFPGGEIIQNDDAGDTEHSFIRAALPEDGTYEVTVTSYEADETGGYNVNVTSDDTGSASVQSGSLAEGDETLENGEFFDTFSIQGQAGQRVEIRLGSDDFDTFLMLENPDGSVLENDDVYEESSNSALRAVLPAGGEYLVHVTSYDADETGDYRLVIDQIAVRGTTEKGRLQEGDETLESDEFVDTYTIDASQGEVLDILLVSSDFDPYVIVTAPNGDQYDTDDLEIGSSPAGIRMPLTQDGTYEIMVTSFESGESGQYYLSIGRE